MMDRMRMKLFRSQNAQKTVGTLAIIAVALVGVRLLSPSHATSPAVSSQATLGTRGGNASLHNDVTASDGESVEFGLPFYDGKTLSVQSGTSDVATLQKLHANSMRPEISFDTAGTAFNDTVDHDGATTEAMLDATTTAHIQPIPLLESYVDITPGSNVYIDPTTWATAVVNWCKSYCAGGTFYVNNTAADEYYAPHVLEMLNEPYGGWYRDGAVPPEGYANMLIATRAALNTAGLSDISILGAAGNAGDGTNSWTAAVAADGGYAAAQGLAIHPYSSLNISLPAQAIAQDGWDTLYYYHQLYNMNVYVTEVGWCSQSTVDVAPCDGRNQPEASKDADITDAIDQLATVPWIMDFNDFDLHDFSACIAQTTGPCINEFYSYGLYLSTGAVTPAFSAYETAATANGF
jgi:hypothetical protein